MEFLPEVDILYMNSLPILSKAQKSPQTMSLGAF